MSPGIRKSQLGITKKKHMIYFQSKDSQFFQLNSVPRFTYKDTLYIFFLEMFTLVCRYEPEMQRKTHLFECKTTNYQGDSLKVTMVAKKRLAFKTKPLLQALRNIHPEPSSCMRGLHKCPQLLFLFLKCRQTITDRITKGKGQLREDSQI